MNNEIIQTINLTTKKIEIISIKEKTVAKKIVNVLKIYLTLRKYTFKSLENY
jgi:hypothetical protein